MSVSQVRIIGGKWRSRKIAFPVADDLRPTGDRLRETLFNWLAASLRQARCLDVFAGSGALGLEALSRGAGYSEFWEQNAKVVQQLQLTVQALKAESESKVVQVDALHQLGKAPDVPFDIIFLDPPFSSKALPAVLKKIVEQQWLSPGGYLSVEADASDKLDFGLDWHIHRSKVASGVQLHLLRSAS